MVDPGFGLGIGFELGRAGWSQMLSGLAQSRRVAFVVGRVRVLLSLARVGSAGGVLCLSMGQGVTGHGCVCGIAGLWVAACTRGRRLRLWVCSLGFLVMPVVGMCLGIRLVWAGQVEWVRSAD